MNQEKEELIIKKKLFESAQLAYQKGITVYTDFLGLAEQNLFFSAVKEFPPVTYACFGGIPDTERFCICFDGTEHVKGLTKKEPEDVWLFPISCVCISDLSGKYAEALTHRDYLGALLNLGLSRTKIGDIYIKNNTAYVFCITPIAEFICKELCTVKHTQIHCEIVCPDEEALRPTLKEMTSTVASLRLDAFLPIAFQTSRSSISAFIEAGKTFVNGKMILKGGTQLEEGDVVSVRGKGRFVVSEIKNLTKKGRTVVTINKYI